MNSNELFLIYRFKIQYKIVSNIEKFFTKRSIVKREYQEIFLKLTLY